ncbi:MAG: hypothetical protein AAFO75_01755 [Pseudomonadota bacterium]
MEPSNSELIFAGCAGAAIGVAYQLYTDWDTVMADSSTTLGLATAAAIGAIAALLAVSVRNWVNNTKE